MRLYLILLVSITLSGASAHALPFGKKKQEPKNKAVAPAAEPARGSKFIWTEMKSDKAPFAPRGADTCTELSIDERYFGPGRNQGPMGWCFAYSLSDLLTHCTAQAAQASDDDIMYKYRVSAADIALGYAAPEWKKGPDRDLDRFLTVLNGGGFPGTAMERMEKRGGTCREWAMTSDPESFWHLVKYLGEKIPATYKAFADSQPAPDMWQKGTPWLLKKFLQLRKDHNEGKAGYLDKEEPYFSRLSFLSDHLKNAGLKDLLASTTDETYLEALDARLCTNRVELPDACASSYAYYPKDFPRYINDGKDGKSNIQAYGHSLFPRIDEVLASGAPVGFAVESHFLTAKDNSVTGFDGGHAMLIIGRKYVATEDGKGECRYKVRNSWKGAWVNGESLSYCGSNGAYSPFVKDCDSKTGYFWVSEDIIRKNIQFINYLGR